MAAGDDPVADGDGGGRHQPSVPFDDLDAAALHQAGETAVELADHRVLVGIDFCYIDSVEG